MCVCLWAALMCWLRLCLYEQVHNAQPQPPHRSSSRRATHNEMKKYLTVKNVAVGHKK